MKRRETGGICAAAKVAPIGVAVVINEFKKLNSRQTRAAFADHWIGIWAREFDDAWSAVYELLKIVEEDELYKDPRRVGPGAPGSPVETHAKESAYPDFKTYFTERVGKSFDRWAELEKTYQYAQRFAPEIFEVSYNEARIAETKARMEAAKPVPKQGEKPDKTARGQNGQFAKAEPKLDDINLRSPGPLFDAVNLNQPKAKTASGSGGTSASYLAAKIKRDAPDIAAAVERGEYKSMRAAARAAGIKLQVYVQVAPTVAGFARAIHKHLGEEQRAELRKELDK